MLKLRFVLLVAGLVSSFGFADDVLSLKVGPGNKLLHYMGRFANDYRFGWTACCVQMRFRGTDANAVVKLTRGKRTALQVVVDGTPTDVLIVTKNQSVYPIARKLPAGKHTVELWKRPEGYYGELKLVRFELNSGAKLLSLKPRSRKILVIGDSISCGYGNEAKSRSTGNTIENQNGYMTYGPIAARALEADVMSICVSGRGLYRNRGNGSREGVLPKLFDRTLPLDAGARWDHSKYVPDVVVINLGTNDRHRGDRKQVAPLKKEDFLGAYRVFIKRLRTLYPNVKIIASIGPMILKPIDGWLPELETSEKGVYALNFERKPGDQYIAGHWHPSVAMNKVMAEVLTAKIRTITGWK